MKSPQQRAFGRVQGACLNLQGRITYVHPTKGRRWRRPTPQLLVSLMAAGKISA